LEIKHKEVSVSDNEPDIREVLNNLIAAASDRVKTKCETMSKKDAAEYFKVDIRDIMNCCNPPHSLGNWSMSPIMTAIRIMEKPE
jgi:hypothetical protein